MTALLAAVLALGQLGSPMLGGVATFYDGTPGHAAAGPTLRATLGLHWRGSVVTVCAETCIVVTVDDWCACGQRHGKDTLLDLDRRDFAKLADPSRGVVLVTVELGGPALPETSTEPSPLERWLAVVR